MNSQTDKEPWTIETYPHQIEAIISRDDFLKNLKSSIGTPGNTIEAHEIPGVKTICGTVQGDRFKIRKAGALANPYSREIVGVVEYKKKSGCLIKYRLDTRPAIMIFNVMVILGITGVFLMGATGLLVGYSYVPQAELGRHVLLSLGIPFGLLILYLFYSRFAESTGESDEEELLDHLKKHAAGINVSS